MDTKKILLSTRNWVLVVLGLALYCFGWTAFLIPNQVTGGGISGIAAILFFATGLPVGITTLTLNIILVSVAWRILGRRFCVTTLVCTALMSAFMTIGQLLFPQPMVPDDPFMCAVIGAALAAVGVGIALTYGGNTGGTDIVVLMMAKYRNISYGRGSLYLNILIVLSSYFTVHDPVKLVYSIVVLFGYILISDLVIDGYRQTFQFMVFSTKNHEIAERINSELHRGATFLKGSGSFNHQESDVLLIVSHRTDKAQIIRIIKEVDSCAFITVSKVQSVFGRNFEQLR